MAALLTIIVRENLHDKYIPMAIGLIVTAGMIGAGAIYLLLNFSITRLLRLVERRLSRDQRPLVPAMPTARGRG